jgi:glycerol-3-phosphate dehydrogenase
VLTYHWVTEVLREGDRVAGVVARDDRGGGQVRIEAGFTINAGGVWAGRIADLAGCHGVTVVPGKGIMIAMNHRLVSTVINRCDPPGDGDILVPIRTVCVIGTTDVRADDPDDLSIGTDEVQQMLDAGEVIVPGFRQTRALHAWTGARPLFHDERASEDEADTRHMSRGLAVVDHAAREADLGEDQIICECELMSRRALVEAATSRPGLNLDDVRRTLRLGMGPCQGGFCTYRAAGILHELGDADAERADGLLLMFLQHRWMGLEPILYGDQMRQACLAVWISQGTTDVAHLPADMPERPVFAGSSWSEPAWPGWPRASG